MTGRASLAEQFNRLSPAWRSLLAPFLASPGHAAVVRFVDAEVAAGKPVYPQAVFHALELLEPDAVKVVILGQDPYHGPGQAHGLAFSVPKGVRLPPSLRNIFAELQQDVGCAPPAHGNLESWARQGVLLLNTVLTVEGGQPQSHAKRGWEAMTDTLIAGLARDATPKVFMLWGAPAQSKRALIGERHLVLVANHPSPLSARRPPVPFLGCRHFSQANRWLVEHAGRAPIDWTLT